MKRNNLDDFDNMQKFIYGWFIFVALIIVATLFFAGFVILKLLSYFGVL